MALNGVSSPAYIALQAYMGAAGSTNVPAIFYQTGQTSPALSAQVVNSYTVAAPVNGTPNTPVSVSTLSIFPNLTAPVFLGIYDATSPGQLFYAGLGPGSAMIEIAPNGFAAFTCGGTLPTTIYLANPSSTVASDIVIVVMSN